MRVLHVIGSLDPRNGGPPRVMLEMATAQDAYGLGVSLMYWDHPERKEAVDRFLVELGAEQLDMNRLAYPGGMGMALGGSYRSQFRPFVADCDVVHLHGVWEPHNWWLARECRRLGKPYIIRPAGVFKPHAMRIKAWKKRLMLPLMFRPMVNAAAAIHATALEEANHLRHYGLRPPVAIVANGLKVDKLVNADRAACRSRIESQWPQLAGHPIILFLARLHPIKGLENLAKAWVAIAKQHPDWRVVFAGPDSDGFMQTLKNTLSAGGALDQCLFTGMVEGDTKNALYVAADLFVLPSFTENFGMSIVESLAAGVPVITTQGTPWQELINEQCGWWIEIGDQPLVEALEEAMALSPQQRAEMGRRGRQLVQSRYSAQATAEQTSQLYDWVCGKTAQQPDFVYTKEIPAVAGQQAG